MTPLPTIKKGVTTMNTMCEKCIWLNTKCEGEKNTVYTGCVCRCTDAEKAEGKNPYWRKEESK